MFYLCNNQIRQIMDYCCKIWEEATQSLLSSLDWVKNLSSLLVGKTYFSFSNCFFFLRRNFIGLSLFSYYLCGKCSHTLNPQDPLVRIFTVRTLVVSTYSNCHFLCFQNVKRSFPFSRFSQELPFCETDSREGDSLTNITILKSFKLRSNQSLLLILLIFISCHLLLHSHHTAHLLIIF